MHAAIKIMCFLVFGAAVSTGNGQVILAGLSLLVPLYIFSEKHKFHGALIMFKRLKWLFVSILVVYLFFTPGQLLIPDVLWGPTVEGMIQGMHRIVALMLLVAAVNLLLTTTEQGDFLSAVLWCLRPLSVFGISHERMGIRITLTLDAVSQSRSELARKTAAGSAQKSNSKLLAIAGMANRLFTSTIATAETVALREISLPRETRPPLMQWLIPIGLVLLFAIIHNIPPGELV